MKTPSTSACIYLLVFCIAAGTLSGCGSWFTHKNAQGNKQKEQEKDPATLLNNKTAAIPLDSIILRTETDVTGGASGYIRYYFDTTKLKYFPDLNAQTIYTNPEYKKALFGWGDDYTVKSTWLYYKGIHYYRFTCSAHERNGKLITANGIKFIPLADPSDIKISPEQAIEIMLAQDYPTRKEEYRTRYLDSLGYIPARMDSILREYPYDFTKDYLPNAKFPWETKNSDKVDVSKHYAYPKPKLIYLASATPESPLVYRAELQTLRNSWEVYIDAVTGKVLIKYRQDDHFTCDPIVPENYTADYLYYYDSTSPMPVILFLFVILVHAQNIGYLLTICKFFAKADFLTVG